jgi:hypothetical protein
MCKECYVKDCQCKCFFENIPIADILSGVHIEMCLKCAHTRKRTLRSYKYDQYKKSETKKKERAKNENRK